MKKICLFLMLVSFSFPHITYSQTTWHPYATSVSFKIKNAGFTVNGTFDTVSATLVFSADKLAQSALSGKAVVNSIHTGISKRDKDLKKEEYFDTEKYADILIKSTKLYYKNAQYAGMFDVTIKGITKEVEIPFEFNPFADEAAFKGTFTIDRRDFKIGGSSMIMGDNVTIAIAIKAKK